MLDNSICLAFGNGLGEVKVIEMAKPSAADNPVEVLSAVHGHKDRRRAVRSLAFLPTPGHLGLAAARADGSLELLRFRSGRSLFAARPFNAGLGAVPIGDDDLLALSPRAEVALYALSGDSAVWTRDAADDSVPFVESQTISGPTRSDELAIGTSTQQSGEPSARASFQAFDLPPSAHVAAFDACGGRLFLAGRDVELTEFDLASQTLLWKARNVPPTQLQLQVPVRGSAVRRHPHTFACASLGTSTGEMRVYDRRSGDRPCQRRALAARDEARAIKIVEVVDDEYSVLVGDVQGYVWELSLRFGLKTLKKHRRVGGVTGLHADSRHGLFVCSTMDRHVSLFALRRDPDPIVSYYTKVEPLAMAVHGDVRLMTDNESRAYQTFNRQWRGTPGEVDEEEDEEEEEEEEQKRKKKKPKSQK